jgi:hypothetical protein
LRRDKDISYLLILAITPPHYISIGTREIFSSYETIKGFELPQGYRVIAMDEGDYRYSRLKFSTRPNYYRLKDNEFDFHIEAGKINYSGHLMFEYIHYNQRLSSSMVNHISQAFIWLKQNNPHLLENYKLKYSGLGVDDFMQFYSEQ